VAKEAMEAAKRHGVIVSYDLNYRESLWKGIGGQAKAREVNRELAKYVDVMIGNEEDFTAALGFEVEGVDEHFSKLDPANFRKMIEVVRKAYPNFQVVATTLRNARTATVNDWGAVCSQGDEFFVAPVREGLEIYDRVGGGDSFASGLIYGFLTGKGPQWAVECGAAHGALAMTTPGDTSMATLSEVLGVMKGGGARVSR
jgi:2-dehydro-3-deoxygluconokinase